MSELEPLQKVHYSWPVHIKDLSDEQLLQYTRLTRALSLSGHWATEEQVARAVKTCDQINRSVGDDHASLGVVFSPWDDRYQESISQQGPGQSDYDEADESEYRYLDERSAFVAQAVADANRELASDVKVTCVMLESEAFRVRPDDPEHNAAIDQRYRKTHQLMRSGFPDARIEWYNRGGVHPDGTVTGWSVSPYFTGNEPGDSYSCSLYRTPEIETTREIFRRTSRRAEQNNCKSVTPWVALASGYRRQTDQFHQWSYDWNYDLIYSYQLGSEINHPWFGTTQHNDRFAPWNQAEIAVFYPEPFSRVPHWGEHFVAYVRGAHQIKELPVVSAGD